MTAADEEHREWKSAAVLDLTWIVRAVWRVALRLFRVRGE